MSNKKVDSQYRKYLAKKNKKTKKSIKKIGGGLEPTHEEKLDKIRLFCKSLKPKNSNYGPCSMVTIGNNVVCSCNDGEGNYVNMTSEIKKQFGKDCVNKKGEILINKVVLNYKGGSKKLLKVKK